MMMMMMMVVVMMINSRNCSNKLMPAVKFTEFCRCGCVALTGSG